MQTIGKIINGKYVRYGAVSVGDKLGDAAFANIVNNATTTEEGFVPDARVVAQQQQIITQQQEQIDSLNSAMESTKMKSKEYNIKNVTISANNYILYRVNPGFNIRFVTVMGISGVITNTPFIYGVYDYIVIVAPNGTTYTEIQLLLWH